MALAGCTGTGPTAASTEQQREDAQLQAMQRSLTERALAGLKGRTCAPATGPAVRLRTLPAVRLDCLGQGPAREVSRGDARPTVVNLWASWCAPCAREMPLLQRTSVAAGDRVRFVGVDTQDTPAAAAGLLTATGVTYEQYADPPGTVRAALRAVGLPVTLVYDATGREVARRFGEVRGGWLDDALRRAGAGPAATP